MREGGGHTVNGSANCRDHTDPKNLDYKELRGDPGLG